MKNIKGILSTAVLLVPASLFAAPFPPAPVLLNGSFESGDAIGGGGFMTVNAGATTISNWTVTGNVDYIAAYWQASDGSRSVDLNGTGAGGVSQPITGLVPNTTYQVSFDLAGNPDNPPAVKNVTVQVGSHAAEVYSFTTTLNAATRSNMGWLNKTYTFTTGAAAPSSQVLTFSSPNLGGYGPALDNVVVSVIPEPGTAALLAIMSGSAMLLGRRRHQA